jgi:hypothetical protein
MDFTFGIVTAAEKNHRESLESFKIYERIKKIINTIEVQKIPNYEIVIVGGEHVYSEYNNLTHIPFDDQTYFGWITKKKNLIIENSKYENIVFMHDYYSLDKEWYANMLKYGNDFHLLMNPITDINGNRYHDWEIINMFSNATTLLPYDVRDLTKFMYFSGGFWIAKKSVMIEFPLDESLRWGQAEDVKWSQKVKSKYEFELNIDSKIKLLKPRFISKDRKVLSDDEVSKLRSWL